MTEQAARREAVVPAHPGQTPGDRALGEPVQWAAMRHSELFRAVHENNEPGQAHARGRQWTELADEVEEASSALQDAVRGSSTGWRGQAADAARTALTELARRGDELAKTMRGVGQNVGRQASVMEWAKAEMPEPSNFDPGAFVRQNYVGGDLNGLAVMNAVAIAMAAKDANSKHDHAVHVMTEMEKASREIDEKTPAFQPDDITFRGHREARSAPQASPGAAGPHQQGHEKPQDPEEKKAEPGSAPDPQAGATQRMTPVGSNQPAGVHAMSAPSTAGPPQSAPPPTPAGPAAPPPLNAPGNVPAAGSAPTGGSGGAAETRKLRPVPSGSDKPNAPKAPDPNAATHKLRALNYEPPKPQARGPESTEQKTGGPNMPASTTSASTHNTPATPPRFVPPSGLPQGEQQHVNQFQSPQGNWTPSFRGDLPSRPDKPGSGPGAGGRPPAGGVPGPGGPAAFRPSGGGASGAGGAPSLETPAGSPSGGSENRLSPGGTSSAAPAAGGSSATAGGGAPGGGGSNAGAAGAAPMGGMAGGAGARQGGGEDKEHQSRGYLKDQNPFQVNDRPAPPVIGVKFKKKRPTGKDDAGDADG